jgi:D-alanyl-lipoteichoic acid acyltransferase DltB (MBOAT superfamily)
MNIVSWEFAAFLGVVLLVYYFLSHRLQNAWLLCASLFFYATWSWWFPLILAGLAIGNYWFGIRLAAQTRYKQLFVWIGIILNLGVLGIFKYTHFFIRGINKILFELNTGESVVFSILFPLGLSYVVLQLIAYLVGISRKQIEPQENFLDFALYLIYFPKLTAGPIEKFKTFLPKLSQPRQITAGGLSQSILLILIGLLRKTLLAGFIFAVVPKTLTIKPQDFSGSELYFWILGLGFYVYNDFAGYTDIVRGISGLFGIELSMNFQVPAFSRNFSEFWLRWHISLSTWLRDYIYLPTSRMLLRRFNNPIHPVILVVPPIITMIGSALWHEAAFHVVLWGILMGSLQVLSNLPLLFGRKITPSAKQPIWRQSISRLVICAFLVVVAVPFFASVQDSVIIWKRMLIAGWDLPDVRILLIGVPTLLLDWAQHHWGELGFLKARPWVRALLLAIALLLLLLVSLTDLELQPFLYQEF